jgi:hypothetical protein
MREHKALLPCFPYSYLHHAVQREAIPHPLLRAFDDEPYDMMHLAVGWLTGACKVEARGVSEKVLKGAP